MPGGSLPEIDAYIERAQPFARPVLKHLRALVHRACPAVEEAVKWSRPFFLYRSAILGNMAAFKEHCSFGLWGAEIAAEMKKAGVVPKGPIASLQRITQLADLPGDDQMLAILREAVGFIESGAYTSPMSPRARAAKPRAEAPETPPALLAMLAAEPKVEALFDSLSPSCRREYLEWLTEAKRPETQARRLEKAMELLRAGQKRPSG